MRRRNTLRCTLTVDTFLEVLTVLASTIKFLAVVVTLVALKLCSTPSCDAITAGRARSITTIASHAATGLNFLRQQFVMMLTTTAS